MAQPGAVMTNMGPRRTSARLEPLTYGNGRGSPADLTPGDPSTMPLPDGRAPSAHLPPLPPRVRDPAGEAFDQVADEELSPGASPARRARKAALMTRAGDVDHRSVLQASLALDQKEREMALVRDNKREYGRILLELWVNQVLDSQAASSPLGATNLGDPLKLDPSALKGLASYGLTRVELLGAGLSNDAIDRLYRCMYVYTVGFFDVMQDTLSHNEFKTEILSNVWKGFLTIAESALQVSFRSDYLKLYQSQQVAMAELLFAKEQLSEARQDSVNTEKAVAWLTNAHAEERAARQALKAQLQEVQGLLDRERQAHQAAVTKYVAEVEERVRLQAQLQDATGRLAEAAVAQVDLIVQRDHLTSELAAADLRSGRLLDKARDQYQALAMDKALKPKPDLAAQLESLVRSAALLEEQARIAAEAAAAAAEAEAAAAAAGTTNGGGAATAENSASGDGASTVRSYGLVREPPPDPAKVAAEAAAAAQAAAEAASTALAAACITNDGTGWPVLPNLDATGRTEATNLYLDLVEDFNRQLYGKWQEQTELASSTTRSLYEVRDALRASKLREHELQVELDRTRSAALAVQKSLTASEAEVARLGEALGATETMLHALREAKAEADAHVEQLTGTLGDTREELATTQVERNQLLASCQALNSDVIDRDQRIDSLEARLHTSGATLAEVSRAMVVYAKAAAAQDIARGLMKQRFLEASKRAGDLQWSIFRSERQIRALEARMEHKNNELATLAAASEQAKHAAEQTNAQLASALMEVENKKALIGSLERALTGSQEEAQALREELEATLRRAEEAEMELEQAREEIARQVEALEALEGRLAAAGEERARLLKQIERLVHEKAEVERMSKQQRESMQGEINQRGAEIASLRSDLESSGLRLEAARAELAQAEQLMERKRGKKRDWKAAHAQASLQVESLQGSLAAREGMVAELSARIEAVEVDVALLMADRGRDSGEVDVPEEAGKDIATQAHAQSKGPGDISAVQQAWDEANRQALEWQAKLETQQKAVEAARREYETARAAFYEAPTEEGRKNILLGIEAVLAKLRVERAETEKELGRVRERQAGAMAQLAAHENAAFNRRVATLAKRTGKTEFLLQHELSRRLDDAGKRQNNMQVTLDAQSQAAVTAQSRAAKLDMDFVKTEAELRDISDRLKKTIEFKVELERQVAQYKNMVGFLQAEVSSLSRERDALKANLQDVDTRIERLTADVNEAQSAVGTTSKRLEAKFEAEKRDAVAAAVEKQRQLESKLGTAEGRIQELEGVLSSATDSLRRFVGASLAATEALAAPTFIWHLHRPQHLTDALLACTGHAASDQAAPATPDGAPGVSAHVPPPSLALALGSASVFRSNFEWSTDHVLRFLSASWSFDVTLVTISQVYVEKLQADIRTEDQLLGGAAGPRCSLESVIYDFFTSRFGCRQAAEMHLGAFLWAVRRFRGQHPKVRTFSRLIGLPEPAPAPGAAEDPLTRAPLTPSAVEFYLSLVNRVHARAGPLIAEAAEGFSLVKAKVLTRLAREFLRGSFATTRDDVAATPDFVRHMALNDEEKSIDLELALEAVLRAFVAQYGDDLESLRAVYRTSFDNVGRKLVTPDDLGLFLRQLNSEKATAMGPAAVAQLYVKAARAAGPAGEELGAAICRAVLESGFVGISTHITRHEPMRSLPPYDEFELLEASWRLVRVAVEQQVAVIKARPESIKCDVVSYVDLARRVEELVGGHDNPGPAWSTYRRLLTTYHTLRPVCEEILPFDPPLGSIPDPSKHRAARASRDNTDVEGAGQDDASASASRDASPARRGAARSGVGHKTLGAALGGGRPTSGSRLGEDAAALYDMSGTGGAAAAAARKAGKLLMPKSNPASENNSPERIRPTPRGGGNPQEELNSSVVKLEFGKAG
ncbi:hypothetical protein HYH03_017407 [Edaphochlamys debaryana]|uniref:Flagellar associated protein n=1 Tax=Edaphochlamys debaryana TaxID=47281 RepID=A0A835XFR7_9CHLO|nr:hypothetical protein HYH03_017407 [Edaphochlamys debaryana]|eukprot:KAG2483752.1 hypothetical protein HYH03_017407 [Edaphochlamys debaryana]